MTENTNTIAQTIEQNAPVLVKKIGKTTYMVGIHFSETSKETMDDKVARLVKSDIHKQACGWDLVYLYNADIPWYKSHGAYIWQQSICWTFILLAGFSWHLGKKHMKRGLWAFGGGVVVSLVTAIVLPNDRVRYGVLTLIGSCILIWILLDKVLKKIPAGVGVSVSFVLFLILRSWTKQDPIQLSDNLLNVTWLKSVLAYIGFPQAGFSSTDYFPLLPWIFLFATGYFLYSFLQEKGLINRLFGKWKVPGINFLGKHSLIIYMIHQPICYVVAFLVSEIF